MTTEPLPPPLTALTSNDRLWAVLCHISYLFGMAVISFVFPLVVYLVMGPDAPYVKHHAREALNFHLSVLVYLVVCVPLLFILVGLPLLVVIGVGGLVLSIIAAVKASDGVMYRYPLTIPFVRG